MAYEVLSDKSYSFAVRVVELHKRLKKKKQNYCMGDQVLRSATSIGANVCEGIYSQSILDNIAKFSIALKEANETRYWLRLLKDTGYINEEEGTQLIIDCFELIKILIAILKTLKSQST